MVKLTDEQRAEYAKRNRRIVAAARAGIHYQLLADRFGLRRCTISFICTTNGYRRKRSWKIEELKRLRCIFLCPCSLLGYAFRQSDRYGLRQ